MRTPLRWLRDYVDIPLSPEELAARLTRSGNEVERIDRVGGDWSHIVVGRIDVIERVPRADRLQLVHVDLGNSTARVVTGATNVVTGDYVPVALPGAILGQGDNRVAIQSRKFSGVQSDGMLCSGHELGLDGNVDGIMILQGEQQPGTPLSDVAGDVVLEFAITPNRPDCLSMLGIAREVAALTAATYRHPVIHVKEQGEAISTQYSVRIDSPDLCARYVARVVRGITVGPSPAWLAQRLRAAGLPVISNVVDVSNYVMWELGQPLHTFDAAKIRQGSVVVRRARPGETILTIDGKDRSLDGDMLVIADAERPIAVAGIMGGIDSEVSDATREVFIESAHFDPASVRRTRVALGLPSEASRRFERGVDRTAAVVAADRAAQLIAEVAGGVVARDVIDVYPVESTSRPLRLTSRDLVDVIGAPISMSQATDALVRLGFLCEPRDDQSCVVTPPSFRLDVLEPIDLIEEVARLIGYDTIPDTMPRGALPTGGRNPWLEYLDDVRDILVGCGVTEIVTYALTSRERMRRLVSNEYDLIGGVGATTKSSLPSFEGRTLAESTERALVLRNPLSSDLDTLRVTLLDTTLYTMAANDHHGVQQLSVFELGRVYLAQSESLPEEIPTLSIGLAGPMHQVSWAGLPRQTADFFDLKGIVELLLQRLNIQHVTFRRTEHAAFHPGRTAHVVVGGEVVGIIGEVYHPVLERFELHRERVALGELDMSSLHRHSGTGQVDSVPRYPAVTQDLAVVVDDGVESAEVEATIEQAGQPIVTSVTLFDLYRGSPLPLDKKSLAYSVTFQAPDHTLSTTEVVSTRARLEAVLEERLGATFRK